MYSSTDESTSHGPLRSLLLTTAGLAFLAIAIVGVWLPGIPTTGPLILASVLLGKANPVLCNQVLAMRIFAPYRGYVDGSRPFTRAVRFWACGCMWASIAISCGILISATGPNSVALPFCLVGGVVGSCVIFLYHPQPHFSLIANKGLPADDQGQSISDMEDVVDAYPSLSMPQSQLGSSSLDSQTNVSYQRRYCVIDDKKPMTRSA